MGRDYEYCEIIFSINPGKVSKQKDGYDQQILYRDKPAPNYDNYSSKTIRNLNYCGKDITVNFDFGKTCSLCGDDSDSECITNGACRHYWRVNTPYLLKSATVEYIRQAWIRKGKMTLDTPYFVYYIHYG